MRNKKEYALPALMLCIGVFLLPLPAYAECLSWLIQISSLWEELVFDGFNGNRSTAVASAASGRDYLGAETKAEYFEIAQKRVKEAADGKGYKT